MRFVKRDDRSSVMLIVSLGSSIVCRSINQELLVKKKPIEYFITHLKNVGFFIVSNCIDVDKEYNFFITRLTNSCYLDPYIKSHTVFYNSTRVP